MPIPFILAGLAGAAGILGVGGHLEAKDTNERAQEKANEAQRLYNKAKKSLESTQEETEKVLADFGYQKKNVLESSMRQFLAAYDKVKRVQMKNTVGMDEIKAFEFDQEGAIEMRKMADIYSDAVGGVVAGTAVGTIAALAASGSVVVESFVAFGTIGTIGGIAAGGLGAALGAAAVSPLSAIASPVIFFTGISASIKADENMEKAETMYAQAKAAVEKMENSEIICRAIAERAKMYEDLLTELNRMFSECSGKLMRLIQKKERKKPGRSNFTSADFTDEEIKLIAVTRSLAGAVKCVLDTPIVSKEGKVARGSKKIYEETSKKLPDFNAAVVSVRSTGI